MFNGDADRICALHQLRLSEPCEGTLVTGTKREIALLDRAPAGTGDSVTVLDVSMARNREGLESLLARGAVVEHFDHHHAGEPLRHPNLRAPIVMFPGGTVYLLPDAACARSVQGAFFNALSLRAPRAAVAVLRPAGAGLLVASVGASQRDPCDADALCRALPGGGGRAAAAGIDRLPHARLQEFVEAFARSYPGAA